MIDQAYVDCYMKDWREYGSNQDATPEQIQKLAETVTELLDQFEVTTIIDAPCGEFSHYMNAVDLNKRIYQGYDINSEVIASNRSNYPEHTFTESDIVNASFPTADVIICRSFLFHMTIMNAQKTLAGFRNSRSTFLIATTHANASNKAGYAVVSHHPEWGFRRLNLARKPFVLGAPLTIRRDPVVNKSDERYIGVWRLNE